ncbi:regulator of cell cycle RGCC-like [Scleropages formosus]|uniref:regulator of cell cycle RGCC-like n=1 Tax=Scleropages formosus TaxID=113540 RepID=UPI0008781FD1|nr:regulator of cell cycle RGCC-like [Scleropages formosus]
MSSESIDLETELGDVMQEFHNVMEDLMAPSLSTPHLYEHHLTQAKRSSQGNISARDHGTEENEEQSLGSRMSSDKNDHGTANSTATSKAKLGDTDELQSFIDNLDAVLAEI